MKFSVRAAARATGVPESVLRTWERRYGIPRPARSATGRRLYQESDLAVIRRMAALIAAGFPASSAAEAARTEDVFGEPAAQSSPAHPLAEAFAAAAADFDEGRALAAIGGATEAGWDDAFETVLFPGLRLVGERWAEGTISSSNEHFVSEILRREMAAALAATGPLNRGGPRVLLACPEDERHELGLLALALLLGLRGVATLYLGSDVPASDLIQAAALAHPDVVCLAATTPSGRSALSRVGRLLVSKRFGARLLVGGPALADARDPAVVAVPGVRLPHQLREAADYIGTRVGRLPQVME